MAKKSKIDINSLPKMDGVKNKYDRFDLDFLTKVDGKIFNGEFDVTNTPEILHGVPTGHEEIKLLDYLVYRPIPKELIRWQTIDDSIHPDSLDMERWYQELIDYCLDGVWIDGEYWNPLMVYWLNVFVFPVYLLDEDGGTTEDFEPGHPFYCNIDRYIFDILWKCEKLRKDFALMGPRGFGKALDLNELIPTVEGYKRAGEIEIGDKLFDRYGEITKVLATYYHKDKNIYKVHLKDGRSLEVCDEHLWGLYDHKATYPDPTDARNSPSKRYPKGRLKSVKGVYKVVDTKTILAEGLTMGSREDSRWYLPMQGAVQFPKKNYIIDPYTLGAILGDGYCGEKGAVRISCHPDDVETIERVQEHVKKQRCQIRKMPSSKYDYSIVAAQDFAWYNTVAVEIEKLGLRGKKSYDKFIPEKYLLGSEKQRLELLKGLMDTDGYVSKTGCVEYSTISNQLADDFMQLCHSLGIRVHRSLKERKGKYPGIDHRIRLITLKEVFHLTRKKERQITKPGNGWAESVKDRVPIVSIEYVGQRDAICYTVDNEEHLFQAGAGHIVTHNSYLIGNVMDREYRLFPMSWTIVSSTNEETTNEAWSKVEECLNAVETKHKALKHKRITDSLSSKLSGEVIELPDGTTEKRGYLSKFDKIIYGKSSGKTRGKRPTKQLVEEFAAFPPVTQKGNLRSCMRESRGSWWVGSIKKCISMYTGTGGTVENDEAEEVFLNPKAHDILPTYDWDTERGTGVFIPVHVKWSGSYEKTGCPDIKKAEAEVDAQRLAAKDDPISYMGLLQEYPKTISEVFTRRGTNIFNQDKIATQRINIEHGKENAPKPEKGFLNWVRAENGRIVGVSWDPTPMGDIEILEHPHWLSEAATEDEKNPMKNLYVAGCDSIDQGTADSSYATNSKKGSELAIMIKKRVVDKGNFRATSNIYVATYTKRSADVRDDWDNALKLAYYYNSEVNIEYTKIGIVGWFRDKGFYHLLKKRPSINLQGADPHKNSQLIGTTAGGPIIDHQDQKIAAYIDDYYQDIWFPDLLKQLQDYNRDDRTKFDLVIAMGLCELADEDLMGKVAKIPVAATAGLQLWGYYTDPDTGYKKYGVLPEAGSAKKDMEQILEDQKFKNHGGVRWIDASDPTNLVYNY